MAETSSAPVWRVLQGYPNFEASSEGEVRCLVPYRLKRRVLPPGSVIPQHLVTNRKVRADGSETTYARYYIWVRRSEGEKRVFRTASRLICGAFHGVAPSPQHEAAHNNGISTDNRPDNLRWSTPSENQLDRRAHGTSNAGEQHGASKLTNEIVRDIRERLLRGETVGAVAKRYGLNPCKVSQIRSGDRWRHLIPEGEPLAIPSRRRLRARRCG